MTKHTLLTALIAVALVSPASSGPRPEEAITAARLQTHLEFIAHDLLEGRNTPSRGLDIASIYIRSMLKQWGVAPGGPAGSYFQNFAIERSTIVPAGTKVALGTQAWTYGTEFYATGAGKDGAGGLVYVGFGLKTAEIDPYAGLDIKGKWLVVSAGPRGRRGVATRPEEMARQLGALGVVTITNGNEQQWQSRVTSSTSQGQPTMTNPNRAPLTQITITPAAAQALFAGEATASENLVSNGVPVKSFALSSAKSLSAAIQVDRTVEKTQNVIGKIEGTDPKLRAEIVAVSAHYDHVGMRTTGDDKIFNGADDDGSGTVAVLELAHAFSLGKKPKRTMLFIWHAGEERGLWGSAYMRDNPIVPLEQLAALINIDMIGRSRAEGDKNPRNDRLSGPDEIYLVGSRRISNDLGDIIVRANAARYKMKINYRYDEPNDPESIYTRSDHYNYAQKGVPIAFFYDGTHEDYHGVGDEVHKIDFAKMERVTRTIHTALADLASRRDRPRINPKQQVP